MPSTTLRYSGVGVILAPVRTSFFLFFLRPDYSELNISIHFVTLNRTTITANNFRLRPPNSLRDDLESRHTIVR